MTPTATEVQNKTEVFADELTKIVMKVSRKMSKEEREERLNRLNERLHLESTHEDSPCASECDETGCHHPYRWDQ